VEEEKTLFEISDPTVIGRVVSEIRIDVKGSGFHCLCCGHPTFEFYKGDLLLAMVGLHHGRSLRWIEGWAGDALLTSASAEFLLHFLAEHGVSEPLEEHLEMQRSRDRVARVKKLRLERYRAVMDEALATSVFGSESEEDAIVVLQSIEPVARATLAFRLYGSHDVGWNMQAGFDRLVAEKLLGTASLEVLVPAMKGALADSQGVNGVARWLFGDFRLNEVSPGVVRELLPTVGRHALAHPSALNRLRTVAILKAFGGPQAISLLREKLSGVIEPRTRDPEEDTTLGGWVIFRVEDIEVDEGCTDRAFAGLALAKLGDKTSLPAIASLLATTNGVDRKVLSDALRILRQMKTP
jgi:hypothetical protein